MAVTFQLPDEVEKRLRAESANLEAEAKEAYAVELFRRGKLSHFELSKVLGLDRFETDAYLKRHNIYEGSLTNEDLEADANTLKSKFNGPAWDEFRRVGQRLAAASSGPSITQEISDMRR